MAESDTILQLGIDAAREGNREEARSLFSLLTREEPNNTQGWLWLAGVAETPDERRAALERVVALDPSNDMARKGLQAIGVDPDAIAADSGASQTTAAPVPPVVSSYDPPPAPVADVNLDDDERYASELDSAFDDYDAVEKVAGTPRNTPTGYSDDDSAAVGGGSARARIESRRNARARAYGDDDDGDLPPRRGPSTLLLTLLGAILILGLAFILWQFFANRGGGDVVGVPTGIASETGAAGGGEVSGTAPAGDGTGTLPGGTGGVTDTGTLPGGTGGVTDTGTLPGGTGEVTGTGTVPAETPQVQPPVGGNFPDPATANPQQVGIGTQLEANGFSYTFPNATYAASLGGTIGAVNSSTGRFVVVLAYVGNNTGTEQVVPADLFVLKDAQGRVYTTNSAASEAYVQPGINADKSLEDTLSANGVTYSTALVFEVAPDATGLVLFTRPNQGQGFLVLP